MLVYINIRDPRGKIKTFPVQETPVKIGRNRNADITVADGLCSNFHIILYVKEDALYIEDLKSKNGTILNGVKIFQQRVYAGDVIRIGKSKLEVDTVQTPPSTLEKLTPAASRKNGNITLQLETEKERAKRTQTSAKQKEFVKNSKLFEGAPKKTASPQKGGQLLMVKDYLALSIDTLASFIVFCVSFLFQKRFHPEAFQESFANGPSLGALLTGISLFYTLSGLLTGFLFFKWNRGRKNGSLGEKVMGLD